MIRSVLPAATVLASCLAGAGAGVILVPAVATAQTAPPAASSAPAQRAPSIRTLSAEQARADLALMRRGLETIHPGLYRRASKAQIDRAFADLEADLRRPISELEFYRRISLLLALIACDHTKAEQAPAIEAWRRENPSHLPFRFRLIDGAMVVVGADPAASQLARGAEILSINGRPVRALVQTLGAYVPRDGDTVWTIQAALADDGDLMGSDFDHFYPYVFGFAEHFDLVVRDPGARRTRRVRVLPVSFQAWRRLPWDGSPTRSDFGTSTSWRLLEGGAAYLRVGTFVNYRAPVDAAALFARIFGEIRASGATRLILDLRDNGGGSTDATLALMDSLAMRPYVWQAAIHHKAIRVGDLARSIRTWGDPQEVFFPREDRFSAGPDGFDVLPDAAPDELMARAPAPHAFFGPVTVLTGPDNASGSTMLIGKLRDEGRVRLMGGRTGGSADGPTAGRIFNLALPNSGIVVRIPNAFNQMQVSRFDPRGGIVPDRVVQQSVSDWRAGRDTVLEEALAELPAPLAPEPPSTTVDPLVARLAGDWTGTLTYRDFQTDGQVTLPTTVSVTPDTGGRQVTLAYVYDDGPGKIVRSSVTWTVDARQALLTRTDRSGQTLYRTVNRPSADGIRAVALYGRGDDNGVPVAVRETLEVGPDSFVLVRATRPSSAAEFRVRHSYRFTRSRP